MESSGDQSPSRNLDYYRNMPLEKLSDYVEQIKDRAEAVMDRVNTSGKLAELDKIELNSCLEELLPMPSNIAAQEEQRSQLALIEARFQPTLNKIDHLIYRIYRFLSDFENTGRARV